MAIRSISLFAGGGGLDLSFEILAACGIIDRVEPLLYVENEASAAEILAARIAEGSLPPAHIWSDISKLNGRKLRGAVDLIYGGFPCTDISIAGKQAGIEEGEKSGLWREYARLIREIQPRLVYIENVPGVLSLGNGRAVLGELAVMGFDAEWGTFSAAGVGASHLRKRVFILAWSRDVEHPNLGRFQRNGRRTALNGTPRSGGDEYLGYEVAQSGGELANSRREHGDVQQRPQRLHEPAGSRGELAITTQRGRGELRESPECDGLTDGRSGDVANASDGLLSIQRRRSEGRDGPGSAEPLLGDSASAGREESRLARERQLSAQDGIGLHDRPEQSSGSMGNAASARLQERRSQPGDAGEELTTVEQAGFALPVFAPGPEAIVWNDLLVRNPWLRPAIAQAEAESHLREFSDGLADLVVRERTDALRAGGNGVVAICGAAAFVVLARRAGLI